MTPSVLPASVSSSTKAATSCAVLVHYRCVDDVLACVGRLRLLQPELPIVVVDNASADGSAAVLAEAWADDPRVTLLQSATNGGFGAGCNIGIAQALEQHPELDHVLLLNPDTLPEPGFLAALCETAQRHPAAAIIGARVTDLAGRPWFENGRIRRWTLSRSHVEAPRTDAPFRTEFVTGAAQLIDARLLRAGLRFDERFFLYAEDLDLCARVAAMHRELWIDPRAVVRHRVGGSDHSRAVLGGLRAQQLAAMTRSKVLFAAKHLSLTQRGFFLATALVAKPLVGVVRAPRLRWAGPYFRGLWAGCAAARQQPLAAAPVARPQPETLAVVILSYNSCDEVVACLRSVLPQLSPKDRVVVVDNGSSDDTVAALSAEFPMVELLASATNLGFAGGCNQGVDRVLADGDSDGVLLLNQDTIVADGALAALRRTIAAQPDVGVWQAMLVDQQRPDRVDSLGQRIGWLPTVRDRGAGSAVAAAPTTPVEIFGACAAAVWLSAAALRRAGRFDDSMFLVFEDTDLMFRLRAAGETAWLAPDVRVIHARGVSGPGASPVRRAHGPRNAVTLALRWWPWPALLVGAPLLLSRAVTALRYGSDCAAHWRRALAERPLLRGAARRHRVDAWRRR